MAQKTIKKISTLTAAVAVLATTSLSLGITPAFAEEGLWTLEEMIPLSAEFEVELDEACADTDDFMCKDSYIWQKSDPIYWGLYGFQSMQLFVTSFNPSSGAFRVYYNDEDLNTKHMGSSVYQYDLANLYIVQYDKGYIDSYVSDLKNGIWREKRHTIAYESQAANGAGWLPADTEVNFDALEFSSEDFPSNPKLYYTYETVSGLSVGNVVNFESCLNSPDYQDGMECQIRFSSSGVPTYVPAAVVVPNEVSDADNANDATNEPNEPSETNDAADNADDVNDANGTSATTATTATIATETVSSTPVVSVSTAEENFNSTTATTPNTGEATAGEAGSLEFPWWLGAIFLIGTTILAWFFRPNHQNLPKIH